MTHEPDLPGRSNADDLDGFTLEQLNDYLESGRAPRNPAIEDSPNCRLALDSLERLRVARQEMQRADIAAEPPADDGWVDRLLEQIPPNTRPGRRVPLKVPDTTGDFGMTEGSIRGLIRGADAIVPGVFIGKCRIIGDVESVGAPVRIQIEISVWFGQPITDAVAILRAEVARRLEAHTQLRVEGIDIAVIDVQDPTRGGPRV